MTNPAPTDDAFRVVPIAFVVAYTDTKGQLVAVSEHMDPGSALREAARRNAEAQAAREAVKRSYERLQAERTTRRSVRYVEPDAFA